MNEELYKKVLDIVQNQIYLCPQNKWALYRIIMESNLSLESNQAWEILEIVLSRMIHSKEIIKQPDRFHGEAYGVPDDFIGRDQILATMGFAPLKPSKNIKK